MSSLPRTLTPDPNSQLSWIALSLASFLASACLTHVMWPLVSIGQILNPTLAILAVVSLVLLNMPARDRRPVRLGRQWDVESSQANLIARHIVSAVSARTVSQETAEQKGNAVALRLNQRGRKRNSCLTRSLVRAEVVLNLLPVVVELWLLSPFVPGVDS